MGMKNTIGEKYDKIAKWWHDYHLESDYGLQAVDRAIAFCKNRETALDVGCGSGGRIINKLENLGFRVTGIDASPNMIAIARDTHKTSKFLVADICNWESDQQYDLIVGWDSLFHLPLSMHVPVLAKLCGMLKEEGIFLYTFGDGYGEHESDWHNDKFYYSTIGINENLKVIMENNCECRHLELDQYPEKHVVMIFRKLKNFKR